MRLHKNLIYYLLMALPGIDEQHKINELGQEIDENGLLLAPPEMVMLRTNKIDAWNYRFRKVNDWDVNYELYRDKVMVNPLTQRQSVNLPIMKTQIRTLLKDVDDMPVIEFQNLDNDKQAELLENEYWSWTADQNHMELNDIIDKRQVFIFGRTYDQWQVKNGMIVQTIQDPYDILIQRYANPTDINSSRFLIHMHIFMPLSQLDQNPDFNKEAVEDMQKWYASRLGLIKAAENARFLVQRNQRQADMGVPDIHAPMLGETYVELAMHFVFRNHEPYRDDKGEPVLNADGTIKEYPEQIFLYVECDNMRILMKKPLEEVIGNTNDNFWRNHYPYTSWADDIERQDWYSDSIADIIRPGNIVLNTWYAQMAENRTLKNLNMHVFNSNLEGFQPQTWVPKAFGMYGVPLPPNTDLKTVFQPVPVDDLTDSLQEIEFVQGIIEKATGATPTMQGVQDKSEVTLGEIKLQLNNAQQRVKGLSKFYTQVWKERAMIFLKLIEAAPDKLDAVNIYKKGKNSNDVYLREIEPKNWITKSGYGVKIWSQDQRDAFDVDALNKLNAVKANMPDNMKLTEIYERKLLEFAGLKPEEITEVMKLEQEKMKAQAESGKSSVNAKLTESMQLPYQFVPEDIKRQYEEKFGFTPSKMAPGAPVDQNGQPTSPGQDPNQPGQPAPQAPVSPSPVQPTQPAMPAR